MSTNPQRREYEADVAYEVWRSGGNPDCIDPDRIDDDYFAGVPYEDSARYEIAQQRPREEDALGAGEEGR